MAASRAELPDLRQVLLTGDPTECLHRRRHARPPTTALDEAAAEFPIAPTRAEDPALLHFTSGTTGKPKGAVHVHGAIVGHLATARLVLDLRAEDVYWCTADPGWVTGTSYAHRAPSSSARPRSWTRRSSTHRWYRDDRGAAGHRLVGASRPQPRSSHPGVCSSGRTGACSVRPQALVMRAVSSRWGAAQPRRGSGATRTHRRIPFCDRPRPSAPSRHRELRAARARCSVFAVIGPPGAKAAQTPPRWCAWRGRPCPQGQGPRHRGAAAEQGELALHTPGRRCSGATCMMTAADRFADGWYVTRPARIDDDGYFWFVGARRRCDRKTAGHLIGPESAPRA